MNQMNLTRSFHKITSSATTAALDLSSDPPSNVCSIRVAGFTQIANKFQSTSTIRFTIVDERGILFPYSVLVSPTDDANTIIAAIRTATTPTWQLDFDVSSTGDISISGVSKIIQLTSRTIDTRRGLVFSTYDGGTISTTITPTTSAEILTCSTPILGTTNLRSWDIGIASSTLQFVLRSPGGTTIGLLGTTFSHSRGNSITLGTTPQVGSICPLAIGGAGSIAAINFGTSASIVSLISNSTIGTITSAYGIETCIDVSDDDRFVLFGNKRTNLTSGEQVVYSSITRPRVGRLLPDGRPILVNASETVEVWNNTTTASATGVSSLIVAGTTLHHMSPIARGVSFILLQGPSAVGQYSIGTTSNLVSSFVFASFSTASYFGARMESDPSSIYLATTTTLLQYSINPPNVPQIQVGGAGVSSIAATTWTAGTIAMATTSISSTSTGNFYLTHLNNIPLGESIPLARVGTAGIISSTPYEPAVPTRRLSSATFSTPFSGNMVIEVVYYLTRLGDNANLSSTSNVINHLDYNKIFQSTL